MAKLGSFFRRLFTPTSPDNQNSLSSSLNSESRKSIVITSSLSPSKSTAPKLISTASQSCSTSPRIVTRTVMKQITVNDDNRKEASNPKFLSSDINKMNLRRLSAPLIIHTAARNQSQYSSVAVNENTEEELLSSLQRLSVSSSPKPTAHPNNSTNSLGVNNGSPTKLLSPSDGRSSPFNLSPSASSLINSLVNNILPASGTPPNQVVTGAQPSSPRTSRQSNNSPSHNNAMRDISPVAETATNSSSDRKMSLQPRGRRPSMFDPIDPKELQQALYASAAAKASMPTCATTADDSHRTISFIKLSYDRDGEHVFIETLSLDNMQALDAFVNNNNNNNSSNSMASSSISSGSTNANNHDFIHYYCRCRLWPEKRGLFQTKIVRHPRSQSTCLFDTKQLNDFELSYDQLNNHCIELLLYRVGTKPTYKDIRVATVKYDLASLMESDQVSLKKQLDESDPICMIQDPDLGDLLVSLSYLQSAAKLAVVVLEAKNLRPLSIESKPFPEACVKVTLFDRNGKKLKRKKTSVQRASDCPTFNEELVFELRRDIAQEVMIELRVVHESLSYKEQLGSIIFGPNITNMTKGSINPENIYWSTILSGESLNAQWQTLKTPIRIDESK